MNDPVALVRRDSKASNAAWLRGVLVEFVLSEYVEFAYGKNEAKIERACKTWGVDRKAIEKAVVAEQKAAKAAGKGTPPAKASKPRRSSASVEDLEDEDQDDFVVDAEVAEPKPKKKVAKKTAKRKGGKS